MRYLFTIVTIITVIVITYIFFNKESSLRKEVENKQEKVLNLQEEIFDYLDSCLTCIGEPCYDHYRIKRDSVQHILDSVYADYKITYELYRNE